jgi:hypothetical protein
MNCANCGKPIDHAAMDICCLSCIKAHDDGYDEGYKWGVNDERERITNAMWIEAEVNGRKYGKSKYDKETFIRSGQMWNIINVVAAKKGDTE